MLAFPDHGVGWWTVQIGRAVAILAAMGLLAGCLNTSVGGTPGPAGTGIPGTSTSGGNGYGGNGGDAGGGVGGNGGNGYGGVGGNGYGGNGGVGGNGGEGYGGFSDTGAVAGSGRLTSKTIDLSGVTSVVAGAQFVVRLRTGEPARATVTMDDNLTDRVEATVVGDQLHLGVKPGMSVRNATLAAEVTVGRLDRLDTSGISRVVLSPALVSPTLQLAMSGTSAVTGPVTVGQVQATISGASTLALSGQVQDLGFSATGASQLPMADLTVRRLDAVLSGASHATVTVTGTLVAQAGGASALRYRGTPSVTRFQVSGMASVVRDSP